MCDLGDKLKETLWFNNDMFVRQVYKGSLVLVSFMST